MKDAGGPGAGPRAGRAGGHVDDGAGRGEGRADEVVEARRGESRREVPAHEERVLEAQRVARRVVELAVARVRQQRAELGHGGAEPAAGLALALEEHDRRPVLREVEAPERRELAALA